MDVVLTTAFGRFDVMFLSMTRFGLLNGRTPKESEQ